MYRFKSIEFPRDHYTGVASIKFGHANTLKTIAKTKGLVSWQFNRDGLHFNTSYPCSEVIH